MEINSALLGLTVSPFSSLGHPLFFRLLSSAFYDFGSAGRKKKKKNAKIKLENCLEPGGPVPQHNIRELENNKVWLQSQHGGNGGRKNRIRSWNQTRTGKQLKICKAKNCLCFKLK